jgi:hypothetical protein
MKLRKLNDTFYLVKKINNYRKKKQNSPGNNNEKCENYYRVDDIENDGRGTY